MTRPTTDPLLSALDETPNTVKGLARKLDRTEDEIHEGLARLEEDGHAVDWGGLWATTWRAKMQLAPTFFRIWLPASFALGTGFTSLALIVNGPSSLPVWVPIVFALAAVVSLAWGLFPIAEDV